MAVTPRRVRNAVVWIIRKYPTQGASYRTRHADGLLQTFNSGDADNQALTPAQVHHWR
jgi:hypothetical protein